MAAPELPLWRCHKYVRAAKVAEIQFASGQPAVMVLEGGQRIVLTEAWSLKHEPKAGGYFVVYDDGYTSFSPAEPFESGYTKVDA